MFAARRNISFVNCWYGIGVGNFGKFNARLEAHSFDSCREVFSRRFRSNTPNILFCCGSEIRGRAVASFVHRVETLLKIKKFTRFGRTGRLGIIWIEVSSFWMQEGMRRSLFTAILRAGLKYDTKRRNFTDALYSYEYLQQTRAAVERFLQGHTHYTGSGTGWMNTFGQKVWWRYRGFGHYPAYERVVTNCKPESLAKKLVRP